MYLETITFNGKPVDIVVTRPQAAVPAIVIENGGLSYNCDNICCADCAFYSTYKNGGHCKLDTLLINKILEDNKIKEKYPEHFL